MHRQLFSRRPTTNLCLFLAIALTLVSCGGSTVQDYVGTWQGTTSQGAPISFVVQKDLTVFCFVFEVTDSQFRSLGTDCNDPTMRFPISGTTFAISQIPTFTAKGHFSSGTQAAGKITDTADPNITITLTWMATKQTATK
jgi:hypothetical protein